jgi:hypothetical protein
MDLACFCRDELYTGSATDSMSEVWTETNREKIGCPPPIPLVLARMAHRRHRHSVPQARSPSPAGDPVGCWAVGRGAGGVALQHASQGSAHTAGWPWRALLSLRLPWWFDSIDHMHVRQNQVRDDKFMRFGWCLNLDRAEEPDEVRHAGWSSQAWIPPFLFCTSSVAVTVVVVNTTSSR